MSADEEKTKIVSIRFTPTEWDELVRRSKKLEITVSELVRRSLLTKQELPFQPTTKTYTCGAPTTTTIIWNIA